MSRFFFESITFVVIIYYFQCTDSRSIGAGKLPFIDHADRISAHHSVGSFQRSLRNIKSIGFCRTDKSDLVSGKSLESSLKFIHIYTCTVGVDILNSLFSGRQDILDGILQTAARQRKTKKTAD